MTHIFSIVDNCPISLLKVFLTHYLELNTQYKEVTLKKEKTLIFYSFLEKELRMLTSDHCKQELARHKLQGARNALKCSVG